MANGTTTITLGGTTSGNVVALQGSSVTSVYNNLNIFSHAVGTNTFDVQDVKALGLGSASAGPLVVSTATGGRLFDLDTLAEIELPRENVPDQFGRVAPKTFPPSG